MALVTLDIPSPKELRGGWAARAALAAATGSGKRVYADDRQWFYDDGGGNWACMRAPGPDKALIFGNDHEYSETYFREGAAYFQEEETDLLKDAPKWWEDHIEDPPGEYLGFIYGWDGQHWSRAPYKLSDGFSSVGLLRAIDSVGMGEYFALEIDRANAESPDTEPLDAELLTALIAADADITEELLAPVVSPIADADVGAGVAAGREFLTATIS